jgi:hypothetical protein
MARRRYVLGPVVADYVRAIVGGKARGKFVDFSGGRVSVRSSTRCEVIDEAAALAAGPPESAVKVVPEVRKLLTSGLAKGQPWPGVAWVTVERVGPEGGPPLLEREVARVQAPLPEPGEPAPVVDPVAKAVAKEWAPVLAGLAEVEAKEAPVVDELDALFGGLEPAPAAAPVAEAAEEEPPFDPLADMRQAFGEVVERAPVAPLAAGAAAREELRGTPPACVRDEQAAQAQAVEPAAEPEKPAAKAKKKRAPRAKKAAAEPAPERTVRAPMRDGKSAPQARAVQT